MSKKHNEYAVIRASFRKQLLKDMADFKEGKIDNLPGVEEYSKKYGVSSSAINTNIRKVLSKEDLDIRNRNIRVNSGIKAYKNAKSNNHHNSPDAIRNAHLKGKIAEELFLNTYRDEYGWVVFKLNMPIISEDGFVSSGVNYERLELTIKEVFGNEKYLSVYSKLVKIIDEIKKEGYMMPDYLLLKPGKIMFYEIKSYTKTKKSMQPRQKRGIDLLKRNGYKVYIKYYKIDMDNLSPYLTKVAQIIMTRKKQFRDALNEKKANLEIERIKVSEQSAEMDTDLEEKPIFFKPKKLKKYYYQNPEELSKSEYLSKGSIILYVEIIILICLLVIINVLASTLLIGIVFSIIGFVIYILLARLINSKIT